MTDLSKVRGSLSGWTDKVAIHEALDLFAERGGEHRMRVVVDHPDPIVARLVEDHVNTVLEGGGFADALRIAVDKAKASVDAAIFETAQLTTSAYRNRVKTNDK